jgi:hypothetical protein
VRLRAASIFLHEPATDELWTKVALGLGDGEIRIPASAGIVGAAFKSNQLLHVPGPTTTRASTPPTTGGRASSPATSFRRRWSTSNAGPSASCRRSTSAAAATPAMTMRPAAPATRAAPTSEGDRAMLQLLADQAGVAIQRFHLQQSAIDSMALRKELDLASACRRR